jgi:SAM-dependent methyltransferase
VLRRILAGLVASGWTYDCSQRLAGQTELERRLRTVVDGAITARALVVDLGGGTGLLAKVLPDRRYICLDIELPKLLRFRAKHRGGCAVQGDVTRTPFKTSSVDAAVCAKVLHHLTDIELEQLFSEVHRSLRPAGTLIVTDLVPAPRLMSRLLCYLDRGSFPRQADQIKAILSTRFELLHSETFQLAVFHEFVLCVCRRRPECS